MTLEEEVARKGAFKAFVSDEAAGQVAGLPISIFLVPGEEDDMVSDATLQYRNAR